MHGNFYFIYFYLWGRLSVLYCHADTTFHFQLSSDCRWESWTIAKPERKENAGLASAFLSLSKLYPSHLTTASEKGVQWRQKQQEMLLLCFYAAIAYQSKAPNRLRVGRERHFCLKHISQGLQPLLYSSPGQSRCRNFLTADTTSSSTLPQNLRKTENFLDKVKEDRSKG